MDILAVVIDDDPVTREFVQGLLESWTCHSVRVETSGYRSRFSGVFSRWLEEADIFILGLERSYPEGSCAEGVDVATRLASSGKQVLIVGTGCEPGLEHLTCYWDYSSHRSFLEMFRLLVENKAPAAMDFDLLSRHFELQRIKPVRGH